ncbi:hypothetical protein DPMN_095854 [Dreissena polymorpha]|uniref:Uncharacterized protein n=1 Tax=Dreissena polymorpha TaxID=45954 RepID=A0A9D4LA48_DREPO|nr:hypothetical protein DPMN_095854 [Dreissena polymorpha]
MLGRFLKSQHHHGLDHEIDLDLYEWGRRKSRPLPNCYPMRPILLRSFISRTFLLTSLSSPYKKSVHGKDGEAR